MERLNKIKTIAMRTNKHERNARKKAKKEIIYLEIGCHQFSINMINKAILK